MAGPGVAVLRGQRALRGRVRAAQNHTAVASPPGGVLHPQPGLHEREGEPALGVPPSSDAGGGPSPHGRVVPGSGVPAANQRACGSREMTVTAVASGVVPARTTEAPDIETSSEDYARRFAGPVGAWFLQVQRVAVLRFLSR